MAKGKMADAVGPAPDGRLERALAAFVRQEFAAPVVAMTGFIEILLEDARRYGLDDFIPDLERMMTASGQLGDLLSEALERPPSEDRAAGEDFAAFRSRLRHDLRTPLNAIKGYGEMLVEEARESGRDALLHDLGEVLDAADRLLGQIDRMVAFGDAGAWQGRPQSGAAGEAREAPREIVSDVLRTIRPVGRDEMLPARAVSSRILVVDDNESNRELLSRRLTRDGHQVATAADGPSALALAAQGFDLILLDLIMPGMSGFEVLYRLKHNERVRHVPVIVISALDEIDSAVRCIEAGAEDYLPKPINPVLLRARINACLEKKWLRDREQAALEELRAEKERSEALLLNILPQSIVARMRQGETMIADRFSEVTILFCDLVGFTALAVRLPPGRTIELLSLIFSGFDRLAAEHGLEKIKTIGDAYMVAGGLPEPRPGHAAAVAGMALRMLDIVRAASRSVGHELQVRIGIHTGAVVAGIIGTHKFIYDVWGDTVNTASRMETHGMPGRIHVSAATRLALGDQFLLEPRGLLEIKGKGAMETYFLLGRRS